ncbi:hypothetical protein REPUB_Repub20aG0120700 [Reevesia pubescens]
MQILKKLLERIEEVITLKCGNVNATIRVSEKESEVELYPQRTHVPILEEQGSSSNLNSDSESVTCSEDDQTPTRMDVGSNVETLGEGERVECRSFGSSFADSDALVNQKGGHLDSSEVVPKTDTLEAEMSPLGNDKGASTLDITKGALLASEDIVEIINDSEQKSGELGIVGSSMTQSAKKEGCPNTEMGPQEENN